LALGLLLLALRSWYCCERFQLTLHRGEVGVDRLVQQALLLGVEGFRLGSELQPLEYSHLVCELVDGRLLERDLVIATLDLELVGCGPSPQGEHHRAVAARPDGQGRPCRSRKVIVLQGARARISTSGNCTTARR